MNTRRIALPLMALFGASAVAVADPAAGPLTPRQAHEARKEQARSDVAERRRELAEERRRMRAELEAERAARRRLFEEDIDAWRRAHEARRRAIQERIERNRARLSGELDARRVMEQQADRGGDREG